MMSAGIDPRLEAVIAGGIPRKRVEVVSLHLSALTPVALSLVRVDDPELLGLSLRGTRSQRPQEQVALLSARCGCRCRTFAEVGHGKHATPHPPRRTRARCAFVEKQKRLTGRISVPSGSSINEATPQGNPRQCTTDFYGGHQHDRDDQERVCPELVVASQAEHGREDEQYTDPYWDSQSPVRSRKRSN